MEDIVFKPKYPIRFRLMLVFSPVFAGFAAWVAITRGAEEPKAYLGLLVPPAVLFVFARTYRRIRFGQSIVLERFLLPPRVIPYTAIQDVGMGLLKTSQGGVAVLNCDNVEEFDQALEESKNRGYWQESQIKGAMLGRQLAGARTATIALPVAVVISIVATILQPWKVHWFVWFLSAYIPLTIGLYLYFRRRERSGNEGTLQSGSESPKPTRGE